MIASQVLHTASLCVVQTVIILGTAWLLGLGWNGASSAGSAALVGAGWAGISHGIALIVRREAPLIAILNFLGPSPPSPRSPLLATRAFEAYRRIL
jgi:hypothetical protein